MSRSRSCLALLLMMLSVPLLATPARAADPIATTTVLVSPAPGTTAYVGHEVTFTAKVTAADGSVPQGRVYWDDGGACLGLVASAPVEADGTATMTYAHSTAYDTYSLNACFKPTDYNVYQSSEDFSCCLKVQTIPTTTVLVSPQPPAVARTGQTVTFTAKVTAADGSVPQGRVYWDDGGACLGPVASAPVEADGTATMTYAHSTAYDTYSLNACFKPTDYNVYQSSEDFSCCLDVGPIATTTVLVSPQPPAVARPGQPVTLTAQVTAADGSVPQGRVYWDDGGACMGPVASERVGADGKATMTYTLTSPYDSYSLNACFKPDDYDAYQSSEDFSCCLDVGPVTTTTSISSVSPTGGALTGQTVTMRVVLSAADGSIPQGSVVWQATGACGSGSPTASAAVGADGKATLTHGFGSAGPYELKVCFTSADADQYQNSETDNGSYRITKPPPDHAPVVTKDPLPGVVITGKSVTLGADATGTPTPGAQWQRSRDGGKTWSNVPGATGRSLVVVATAAANGNLYRTVFTNRAGKAITHANALQVTQAFRGYLAPSSNPPFKRGSTVMFAVVLGGSTGAQLNDATAQSVPTMVQVRSPQNTLTTQASCPYVASAHQYRCTVKVPSTAAPGTYRVLTLTRLGTGPWVAAVPVTGARNPQPVAVVN
ncbi:MAG: glycoside hydrolase family 10 [Marmoricola sp.]|nr:glycoside hydrolase family 10 [Marmoricola sp.]